MNEYIVKGIAAFFKKTVIQLHVLLGEALFKLRYEKKVEHHFF